MDPIEVLPSQLIFGTKRIQGWLAGIPTDSEDTLRFAEMTGARPMIEKYPLVNAAEGYARMMSGKAEFRVVLAVLPPSNVARLPEALPGPSS
jgi:D-arabinose 1-dehydrogenase-like Zn-dependent alcohol dehydrogenase